MNLRVFSILVGLSFFDCASAQKTVVKDKTTYFLSSIFIGGQKNTLARDKGYIVFDRAKNSATCFTSCNFIQLKYTLKGIQFKFTSIQPAKESCPDMLIGLDSDFRENFPKVTSMVNKGKEIVMLGGKDTLMIFHEPGKNQR